MKIHSNQGFTLLEMLLSITILAIIIIVIFSFSLTGFKTFKQGEIESIMQQDLRIARTHLIRELRNVTYIKLQNTIPTSSAENTYIYLEERDLIKYSDSGKKILYTGNFTTLTFKLLKINDEDTKSKYHYYLEYTITAKLSGRQYQTTSKIILNNLKAAPASYLDNTYQVLGYRGPEFPPF